MGTTVDIIAIETSATLSGTDLQTTLDAKLVKANNLSDLVSSSSARTNLGLGTLATQNGTFANAELTSNKDQLNGYPGLVSFDIKLQNDNGGGNVSYGLLKSATTAPSPKTWTFPDQNGTVTVLGNTTTGTGSTLVLATSPTLVTPNLGTPSTLVGTNITGTAAGLTAGNVTTNANLTGGVTSIGNATTVITNANLTGAITSVGNATSLGSFTSAQLLAALTDETGTGANVFAGSPSFTTAVIGGATMAVFNTTSTTINAFGAATTLNLGGTSTASITTNLSVNATLSGNTKTLNVGTAGASGSTTAINIGSAVSGATSNIKVNITPASDATGDVYYRNSSGFLTRVAIGSNGTIFTVAAGLPTWAAAPTGTVTSVSVTTANGVSGSVATATTTPAITLTLGAITPSSVTINGGQTFTNTNLLSGTYTPTLTNTTNITATTAYVCQYLRVGNTVTVSGKIDIDPAASGLAEVGMTIPVASNFGNDYEAGGTGIMIDLGGGSAVTGSGTGFNVRADTTNNRVTLRLNANILGQPNASYFFSFTYQVI